MYLKVNVCLHIICKCFTIYTAEYAEGTRKWFVFLQNLIIVYNICYEITFLWFSEKIILHIWDKISKIVLMLRRIRYKIYCNSLIDFTGIAIRLGLFCDRRLGISVHYTFIVIIYTYLLYLCVYCIVGS